MINSNLEGYTINFKYWEKRPALVHQELAKITFRSSTHVLGRGFSTLLPDKINSKQLVILSLFFMKNRLRSDISSQKLYLRNSLMQS